MIVSLIMTSWILLIFFLVMSNSCSIGFRSFVVIRFREARHRVCVNHPEYFYLFPWLLLPNPHHAYFSPPISLSITMVALITKRHIITSLRAAGNRGDNDRRDPGSNPVRSAEEHMWEQCERRLHGDRFGREDVQVPGEHHQCPARCTVVLAALWEQWHVHNWLERIFNVQMCGQLGKRVSVPDDS